MGIIGESLWISGFIHNEASIREESIEGLYPGFRILWLIDSFSRLSVAMDAPLTEERVDSIPDYSGGTATVSHRIPNPFDNRYGRYAKPACTVCQAHFRGGLLNEARRAVYPLSPMRYREDESPRGPLLAALDLEGVLIPEIWHALADAFGLPALMRTTREEADYGNLMLQRLASIQAAGLVWRDIAPVLARMEPLPGARAFLDRIRGKLPFVVVTDSFDLFVREAARGLDLDAVLCHRLVLGRGGSMLGWEPRIPDSKRSAVRSFAALGYRVRAAGDSLNDIPMLEEADRGFLFRASDSAVAACGGRFGLLQSYEELAGALLSEC